MDWLNALKKVYNSFFDRAKKGDFNEMTKGIKYVYSEVPKTINTKENKKEINSAKNFYKDNLDQQSLEANPYVEKKTKDAQQSNV